MKKWESSTRTDKLLNAISPKRRKIKAAIQKIMDLWNRNIKDGIDEIIDNTSFYELLRLAKTFDNFAYLRVKAVQKNEKDIARICLEQMIEHGSPIDWELHDRILYERNFLDKKRINEEWKIQEMEISIDYMCEALKRSPSPEDWWHVMNHLFPYRGEAARRQIETCLKDSPQFEKKDDIIYRLNEAKKQKPRP